VLADGLQLERTAIVGHAVALEFIDWCDRVDYSFEFFDWFAVVMVVHLGVFQIFDQNFGHQQ